jgi:hypothetical protein
MIVYVVIEATRDWRDGDDDVEWNTIGVYSDESTARITEKAGKHARWIETWTVDGPMVSTTDT